jgi:hypothetical protein
MLKIGCQASHLKSSQERRKEDVGNARLINNKFIASSGKVTMNFTEAIPSCAQTRKDATKKEN